MNRSQFFKELYRHSEGKIEIRPLPPSPGSQRFFELADKAAIDAHLNRFADSDLYYGVATRNGGGGKKANIVNIPAVWCDLDFKDTPRKQVEDRLEKFPFKPSIIVVTGGGLHLYWLLKEPAQISDISTVEDVNKRITSTLGGDFNACDASRVLRVPGTLNRKYDPAKKCEVIRRDDFAYNLSDFTEILHEPDHQADPGVKNGNKNKEGWLEQLMAGVKYPGRNAAGTKIAGYWINKVSPADVLTILRTWNKNNEPSLKDPELEKIASSVSRYQPEIETKTRVDISNVYDAEKMVAAYREHIANLKKNRFILGIPEIDKRIRGIAGGEVLTIIARSGSFKTAMLQNLLKNYVQNSAWGAVFFSIEMPVASVTERYFQMLDGCTGREVESMFTDRSQTEVAATAVTGFVSGLDRFYTVPTRVSLPDISAYVQLIEAEKGCKIGLIGIDYLGLMEGPGHNIYETTSRLAVGTKNQAKLLNIPAVLLSQVSRKGGSGQTEITLDMGRDSGAIEEGADTVLGLWQQPVDDSGVDVWAEGLDARNRKDLICALLKNRKGPADPSGRMAWTLELCAHAMQIGANAERYHKETTKKKAKLSI